MRDPRMDDPDLSLRLLFVLWPEAAEVFLSHRMVCFGCPIVPFHTVSISNLITLILHFLYAFRKWCVRIWQVQALPFHLTRSLALKML